MAPGAGLEPTKRAQALVTAALSAGTGDGDGGSGASVAGLTVRSARRLGSLWAGYGSITECDTDAGGLIIKEVHPPAASGASHERKLRSYQVEAAFYAHVAPRLPAAAAVPRCLGVHSTLHSRASGASGGSGGAPDGDSGCGALQLVMVDLRGAFPTCCSTLDAAHTHAALRWLAAFHAACWGADAAALGLWEQGSYWCLQTRLAELEAMDPQRWGALRAAAHQLDARLAATPWRTLCHGDFKAANLLFSSSAEGASGGGGGGLSSAGGSAAPTQQQEQQPPAAVVAASFDFQYCGGGSGLRDIAKLFANSVAAELLQGGGEEALLRFYHDHLEGNLRALAAGGASAAGSSDGGGGGGPVGSPEAAAAALEGYTFEALRTDFQLALADYCRFCAGWPGGMWGNVDWAVARSQQCLEELGLA